MIESLLVVLTLIGLAFAGFAIPLLPAASIVKAGILVTGGGLLVGVPTGFWYHVVLHRYLSARGTLPSGWWLRPSALHSRLVGDERPLVLVWFYAGGVGFLITVIGCALVVAGVLVEGSRAGLF